MLARLRDRVFLESLAARAVQILLAFYLLPVILVTVLIGVLGVLVVSAGRLISRWLRQTTG